MGEELCNYYNGVHRHHISMYYYLFCIWKRTAQTRKLFIGCLSEALKYRTDRSVPEPEMRHVILSIFPDILRALELILGYQGRRRSLTLQTARKCLSGELAEFILHSLEKRISCGSSGERSRWSAELAMPDISFEKDRIWEKNGSYRKEVVIM